jgi:hypothetical protein
MFNSKAITWRIRKEWSADMRTKSIVINNCYETRLAVLTHKSVANGHEGSVGGFQGQQLF